MTLRVDPHKHEKESLKMLIQTLVQEEEGEEWKNETIFVRDNPRYKPN